MPEVSIYETAKILGISIKTARRLVKSGKLLGRLVKGKRWLEYRIDEDSIKKYLDNSGMLGQSGQISCQSFPPNSQETNQIVFPKDFILRYEQVLVRLGQLEAIREEYKMLTEKAQSLLEKEAEYERLLREKEEVLLQEREDYKRQLAEKEKIIQEQQKIIDLLTRKKWWQFWKKVPAFYPKPLSPSSKP